jgi:dihydrofolate reductase
MRKVVFAINITLDGFADHTAVIADDEMHEFYTNLMDKVDVVLMGRNNYQLWESFWPKAATYPGITRSMIDFADKINAVSKIVFSRSLDSVTWKNTVLSKNNIADEVLKLKKQKGKFISAGSLSIASQLTKLGLIDEFWFVIHPIILGKGKQLFEELDIRLNLKLIDTANFKSGVVVLHYQNNVTNLYENGKN